MTDIYITNFTNNGQCSNCGQCCGDILYLSKSEIKRIDDYLKKHKVEPTPRCVLAKYDNTCPFRDNQNKRCKIYEVRPDICRVYKCDKTPEEAVRNRELTNKGKLARSMRSLFFNDHKGAEWITKVTTTHVYDRKNKIETGSKNDR